MKVWNPRIEIDPEGKNVYEISDEEIGEKLERSYASRVIENQIGAARTARSIEAASRIVFVR